jgi:hypothetical protein
MQKNDPASDLIPLVLATRMVHRQTRGSMPLGHMMERLNAVAYSLAATGPLYAMHGPRREPRRLSLEELALGVFRRGASELHFLDERPMLTRITVARDTVQKAIQLYAVAGRDALDVDSERKVAIPMPSPGETR